MNRRFFTKTACFASLGTTFGQTKVNGSLILGQGDFRYKVVPSWGVLDEKSPVKNCHGIVENNEGHIILLTDHPDCSVIVYDKSGKLLNQWKGDFKQAHGLSIVKEGDKEVLYISDMRGHAVFKTTQDGEILDKWGWPEKTKKYKTEAEYKPSWTLHAGDGSFYVLDGYGKDYILKIGKQGKLEEVFGGKEGKIAHWGPHGGIFDDGLLIAMSDQQYLLKLDVSGKELLKVHLPGGNPRQIQRVGNYYFVAHLADNWPKDRNSRGFISVLDKEFKVVSNIGGTLPIYAKDGSLMKMSQEGSVFTHPHDLVVARDESLYVAQFNSGNTYPIKLEKI